MWLGDRMRPRYRAAQISGPNVWGPRGFALRPHPFVGGAFPSHSMAGVVSGLVPCLFGVPGVPVFSDQFTDQCSLGDQDALGDQVLSSLLPWHQG